MSAIYRCCQNLPTPSLVEDVWSGFYLVQKNSVKYLFSQMRFAILTLKLKFYYCVLYRLANCICYLISFQIWSEKRFDSVSVFACLYWISMRIFSQFSHVYGSESVDWIIWIPIIFLHDGIYSRNCQWKEKNDRNDDNLGSISCRKSFTFFNFILHSELETNTILFDNAIYVYCGNFAVS